MRLGSEVTVRSVVGGGLDRLMGGFSSLLLVMHRSRPNGTSVTAKTQLPSWQDVHLAFSAATRQHHVT